MLPISMAGERKDVQELSSEHTVTLRAYLDPIAARFERSDFIEDDPISIPHGFDDPDDRMVIGLFASLLAWGRRDIMLAKLGDLCERFAYQPARFIHDYRPSRDRKRLQGFKHRTFNDQDLHGLVSSIQSVTTSQSLEAVFQSGMTSHEPVRDGIEHFSSTLLNNVPGRPARIRKHVARPSTGSACKRINMYLRWMIRSGPVDMGLWTCLDPSDLMLPLDVHSGTQARAVGMLTHKSNDWRAAEELTAACRSLDPDDPCKYDFAFFGTGSAGECLAMPV
ncbi:MAG: TIGR02757 family protein [Rhodothermales bacterium]